MSYRISCNVRDNGTSAKTPDTRAESQAVVECQDVIEALDLNFNKGNALKYLWRAGHKTPDVLTDLKKARQYLDFEIARIRSGEKK